MTDREEHIERLVGGCFIATILVTLLFLVSGILWIIGEWVLAHPTLSMQLIVGVVGFITIGYIVGYVFGVEYQ